MVKMCCEDMKENVCCTDNNENKNDKTVYYSSKFDEYGLPVHDGENGNATSYILIQYCPWCGKKLPQSRRDEWFERLESLGFDSPLEDFDSIPPRFKSSQWYT